MKQVFLILECTDTLGNDYIADINDGNTIICNCKENAKHHDSYDDALLTLKLINKKPVRPKYYYIDKYFVL